MNSHAHINVTTYIMGFISSLILTGIAFALVATHTASVPSIILLALIQILLQLHFFLHLGRKEKNTSNVIALLFTTLVLCIVVGGSLWIMHNLNQNMMMSSLKIDSYMINQ